MSGATANISSASGLSPLPLVEPAALYGGHIRRDGSTRFGYREAWACIRAHTERWSYLALPKEAGAIACAWTRSLAARIGFLYCPRCCSWCFAWYFGYVRLRRNLRMLSAAIVSLHRPTHTLITALLFLLSAWWSFGNVRRNSLVYCMSLARLPTSPSQGQMRYVCLAKPRSSSLATS